MTCAEVDTAMPRIAGDLASRVTQFRRQPANVNAKHVTRAQIALNAACATCGVTIAEVTVREIDIENERHSWLVECAFASIRDSMVTCACAKAVA